MADDTPYLSYYTRVLAYNDTEIQMRKGPIRTVMSNQGSMAPTWTFKTQGMQFGVGKNVFNVLRCDKYPVGADGDIDAVMQGGEPLVLLEEDVLAGSDLCVCQRNQTACASASAAGM